MKYRNGVSQWGITMVSEVSQWYHTGKASLPPARRTSYSSSALGSQRGAAAYVGASVRPVILKGVGAMRHMWYALHAYLLLLVAPRLPPLVGATYGPGKSQGPSWYAPSGYCAGGPLSCWCVACWKSLRCLLPSVLH